MRRDSGSAVVVGMLLCLGIVVIEAAIALHAVAWNPDTNNYQPATQPDDPQPGRARDNPATTNDQTTPPGPCFIQLLDGLACTILNEVGL